MKTIGRFEQMDYEDFYRLFCKGIFRISLLDMMHNIEQMATAHTELPLTLKIGAYRRNLMLSSFSKELNPYKDQGAAIIKALQIYKEEINPQAFKKMDFNAFLEDPIGSGHAKKSEDEKNLAMISKYEMNMRVEHINQFGTLMGVDPKQIERDIRYEAEID